MFMVRLKNRPFYKENDDSLILKLSQLYDIVREGGQRRPDAVPSGDAQQNFVRRTTKYWVTWILSRFIQTMLLI
jgi:SPX domain protein involved in polyphosphate accumulation